jgi:nicotinamidase-related amidase
MENNKTALLVMDMQMGIVPRYTQQGDEIIKNVAGAIKAAREKEVTVNFVRVGFRKGLPEISSANKTFSTLRNKLNDANLDDYMQIHPGLGMKDDDIIVDKKRISAFSGSDLEIILRSKNISHLVLTGIATSGVVLSTLREAFDKDYQLTVLSDGCADLDEEVHRGLNNKIFPKQAEVVTIEDWIKGDISK